jgi:hypothetical protein
MKGSLVAVLVLLLAVMGCAQEADETASATNEEPATEVAEETSSEPTEEELLNKSDPAGIYGAGVTQPEATSIASLQGAEDLEGKLIRVEGTVTDVCPRRGCWIEVVDADGADIRVKVNDGDIVFPLSAKGEHIAVEGTLEKIEMTEQEARDWKEHLAEEKGEEFDPTPVTGPEVMWRLKGTGAEITG